MKLGLMYNTGFLGTDPDQMTAAATERILLGTGRQDQISALAARLAPGP